MAIRKASAAIPTSEDLLPYVVALNDARTPLGKRYLSGQRGGLGKLLVGEEVVAGADRTRTEFFSFLLHAGFFLLLRSLIGLPFELLHEFFKVNPFCRNNHLKLKAEFLPSLPSNNRGLNMNWMIIPCQHDPNIQRGSWLNIDGAFDAATPDREIDDAALSADYADRRKRTAKFDGKPEVFSLFHRRAFHNGRLLPLYIANWM